MPMKSTCATLLTVAGIMLAMTGCSGPDRPAWLSLNPNDWSNRADVDEPMTFELTGPTALVVQSFAGDVVIQGNPKLDKAKVTVVREGLHGHQRSDEAEQSLSDITCTAEIVPGELGQALQIRAQTSSAEPHYQRAHIYVEMPEIHGVRVNTTHGKVYARDIRGRVDISTTEEDVRVMTNQAMIEPVTIVNRNGDIDYRVRGESRGTFDARTVGGQVNHVVRYGTMNVMPSTRDDSFDGVLNEGENRIVLRTVDGDIRIAVVNNPEHVGQFIID
jgi:hypothetical protein